MNTFHYMPWLTWIWHLIHAMVDSMETIDEILSFFICFNCYPTKSVPGGYTTVLWLKAWPNYESYRGCSTGNYRKCLDGS